MSHTILVPKKRGIGKLFGKPAASGDVLASLPGLMWASTARDLLAQGNEILIARDGSARGVAVMQSDEGTMVRMFTASSRVDVDLALEAVLALMAAGAGVAINEDDEELANAAELGERYD